MPAIQASGDVSVGNLPQIRPGKPAIQKARIGLEKTVNLHRFRQPVTDTLILGKEPEPCNRARQFQQVPGRTEEHGAMLGNEVEGLTGETNERSPLSELLHDELPGICDTRRLTRVGKMLHTAHSAKVHQAAIRTVATKRIDSISAIDRARTRGCSWREFPRCAISWVADGRCSAN